MKRLLFFLLFMSIGTLGFYVLLVNEPFRRPPVEAEAPPQPVNVLQLQRVNMRQLDGERLAWELDAASAVLDESSDVAELEDVTFVLYRAPASGAGTVALRGSSGRASVSKRTNRLVLEQDVHLVQQGRIDLRSQRLTYDEGSGVVEASQDVRVESDQLVALADAMDYEVVSERVKLSRPLMYY